MLLEVILFQQFHLSGGRWGVKFAKRTRSARAHLERFRGLVRAAIRCRASGAVRRLALAACSLIPREVSEIRASTLCPCCSLASIALERYPSTMIGLLGQLTANFPFLDASMLASAVWHSSSNT